MLVKIDCISAFKSEAFSSLSAISDKVSATIVFKTKLQPAIEAEDGTILNSNLFPVNANGEVLFLSVASFGSGGNVFTPIVNSLEDIELVAGPFSICSSTSSN